jgi:Family of unknown function (DUF6502)
VAENANPSAKTTEKLLDTAARVLAPLVRLLIARGVTFQMASELLKRVYVKAAQKHFVGDDEATGTQLSLLTGLNRKEIRRLTADELVQEQAIPMASYAAAVFATWKSQRRWRNSNGTPKPLPRRSVGRQLSFDDLVRSVTTDHRPGAILEELTRLGFVDLDDEGRVAIKSASFLTTENIDDHLTAIGESTGDHLNAAVSNALRDRPELFLERFIYSDELSESSAAALHEQSRLHWQRVHDDTIKNAIAAEESDHEKGVPTKTRICVGMYFYSETKDGDKL